MINAKLKPLLCKKISDFQLKIADTFVEVAISEVLAELKLHGIYWEPHFWISDDFFVPDGVPGVALPFYLFSDDLKKIERALIHKVEGGSHKKLKMLIRHEIGHAIDNAYKLRQHWLRKQYFGSSLDYPETYVAKTSSADFVDYIEKGYGQVHPDEDFAETFAMWLDPSSKWQIRQKGKGCYLKLCAINYMMIEVAGKVPLLSNKRKVDEYTSIHKTLKKHYSFRRKQFGLRLPKKVESKLIRSVSSGRGRKQKVSLALEKVEINTVNKNSDQALFRQYKNTLKVRARELGVNDYCFSSKKACEDLLVNGFKEYKRLEYYKLYL